jgi:hypothetical protein
LHKCACRNPLRECRRVFRFGGGVLGSRHSRRVSVRNRCPDMSWENLLQMPHTNHRNCERQKMPYSYGDPSKHSKSAVRRAGDNVARRGGTAHDQEVVRNWRNSHAFVLTTFQNTLRRYIKTEARFSVVFAQRLKRLNTILRCTTLQVAA